jgi:hypothetical protein
MQAANFASPSAPPTASPKASPEPNYDVPNPNALNPRAPGNASPARDRGGPCEPGERYVGPNGPGDGDGDGCAGEG